MLALDELIALAEEEVGLAFLAEITGPVEAIGDTRSGIIAIDTDETIGREQTVLIQFEEPAVLVRNMAGITEARRHDHLDHRLDDLGQILARPNERVAPEQIGFRQDARSRP